MSLTAAVYLLRGNNRSQRIGQSLAKGIRAAGDRACVMHDGAYDGPRYDVAVFYGFEKNMPRIMREYVAAGRRVVFVDLGYWGRRRGGRWGGFHKIAIDGRHPTEQIRKAKYPHDRLRAFNIRCKPYRKTGKHILVAGMSGRAAESVGLAPGAWEAQAIATLRQHTDRPILYRPKPSWKEAQPIPGSIWSAPAQPLDSVLRDAWAVVSHHSNVAIDGLIEGIPAFCEDGPATLMGQNNLAKIERPIYPDGREQWLANLAYCQWNVVEMENGTAWRHLKHAGLLK